MKRFLLIFGMLTALQADQFPYIRYVAPDASTNLITAINIDPSNISTWSITNGAWGKMLILSLATGGGSSTNGLASTDWVKAGFVPLTGTNDLASTNWTKANFAPIGGGGISSIINTGGTVAGKVTLDGSTASVSTNGYAWKVYRALLNQSSTDAPVATILENSLGVDVTWSRDDVGSYTGTFSDSINSATAAVFVSLNNAKGGGGNGNAVWYESWIDSDTRVHVNTLAVFGETLSGEDGDLKSSYVEIRVCDSPPCSSQ